MSIVVSTVLVGYSSRASWLLLAVDRIPKDIRIAFAFLSLALLDFRLETLVNDITRDSLAAGTAHWQAHQNMQFTHITMMTLRLANLLLFTTLAFSHKKELSCDVFLAPSKIAGGGFGAYAARSFEQNEVVEMIPLFLPMVHDSPLLMNTVLNDYHYGYTSIHSEDAMGVILLGNGMFYNHSPEPNLLWTTNIGRGEPSEADPDSVGSAVFVAKRYIAQGEELFSSYGLEDGGKGTC